MPGTMALQMYVTMETVAIHARLINYRKIMMLLLWYRLSILHEDLIYHFQNLNMLFFLG
jgi:hypothetical protein